MVDLRIDVFQLARRSGELAGRLPIARMERLADALAGTDGEVEWRVRGWQRILDGTEPEDFLELSFGAVLQPACMRCLEAVAVRVADTRRYRLVSSEEEAERLDVGEDEFDVLAGDRRFDLATLIEDELILALPAMPRHDACGVDLPAAAGESGRQRRSVAAVPANEKVPDMAGKRRAASSAEGRATGPEDGTEEDHGTGPFAALRQLRRGDSSSS